MHRTASAYLENITKICMSPANMIVKPGGDSWGERPPHHKDTCINVSITKASDVISTISFQKHNKMTH